MLKKLKNIIIFMLAACGVLFIVIMLMPEDDEYYEAVSEQEEFETVIEERNSDSALVEGTESEDMEKEDADNESALDVLEGTIDTTADNTEKTVLEADVQAVEVGTGADSVTIMIYMNGSDLESKSGEATEDISEMLDSGIGENANVVIQTMGTKEWQNYGIAADTAQTYQISKGELALVRDDLGQLDCTDPDTLSEFISYGKTTFPAERYIFIFWDHGGGPVYGFGYDEWQYPEDSLTLDEMSQAFSENSDIYFDIIGMDCCIMANIETCYALAPYCKYALLSEDFESGLGWSYSGWMEKIEKNTGIATPLLGKFIVDDIIEANESSEYGDSVCMGLFNESTIYNLFDAWKTYAYKYEDELLNTNYSKNYKAKGRSKVNFWDDWESDGSDVTISDYYISDVLALIENIDNESDEAKNLMTSLKACVSYYGHSSDTNELTGMSVSLPYGDDYFYDQLKDVYSGLGFDEEYIDWLGKFVSASGADDYYDFDEFGESWEGWGAYESDYGCNISQNGSCEYGYDYEDPSYEYSDYYDYDNSESNDDWIYDFSLDMWYMYSGDTLYLYDDESDTTYYYDEYEDEYYYYDYDDEEWYLVE